MSLNILVIGLPGDRLSEAVVQACTQEGVPVVFLLSLASSAATTMISDQAALAELPAERWFGDMSVLITTVAERNISVILTAGCRYLLSADVIGSVGGAAFNIHPSLLPKYRGFAPLFWQYQKGDLEAGVTVHRMDEGVDTGPLVIQEGFPLPLGVPLMEAVPLYCAAATRVVKKLLFQIASSKVDEFAQEPSSPPSLPLARKPRREDYHINWHDWQIERCWHFLRMDGVTANRILLSLKQEMISKKNQASASATIQWKVGPMVEGYVCGDPGELIEDANGYAVAHPCGLIRLHIVEG